MDTKKPYNITFDIETDGFDSTRVHCIVIQDIDSGIIEEFNDEKYTENPKELPMASSHSICNGIQGLMCANNIISHNGIMFDIPQIKKHYPFFKGKAKHWDTLILSRFYHPNILETDLRRKWTMMPARLYGSHSLEAYGYRLKCYKGEFGKHTDWAEWSQEMQDYCKQDVAILVKLWNHFQKFLKQ